MWSATVLPADWQGLRPSQLSNSRIIKKTEEAIAMQTIKVRSRIGADGKLQLQLPHQLANQEIDVVLVYQPIEPIQEQTPATADDPLIGLFSGAPDLATQSEEMLRDSMDSASGWTWKQS
jgi:hypothetical protein